MLNPLFCRNCMDINSSLNTNKCNFCWKILRKSVCHSAQHVCGNVWELPNDIFIMSPEPRVLSVPIVSMLITFNWFVCLLVCCCLFFFSFIAVFVNIILFYGIKKMTNHIVWNQFLWFHHVSMCISSAWTFFSCTYTHFLNSLRFCVVFPEVSNLYP